MPHCRSPFRYRLCGNVTRGSFKMASNTKRKGASKKRGKKQKQQENKLMDEAFLLLVLAFCILLLLSNFNVIGSFGRMVSGVLFGICGITAYIAPIAIFASVLFSVANRGNQAAVIKTVSAAVLFLMLCILAQLTLGTDTPKLEPETYYQFALENKKGGGVLGGVLAHGLSMAIGVAGSYILVLILSIICIVFITERSFLGGVKKGSTSLYHAAKEDTARRRALRKEREVEKKEREEQEREEERKRRMDKKVAGVMMDTSIGQSQAIEQSPPLEKETLEDVYEEMGEIFTEQKIVKERRGDLDYISVHKNHPIQTREKEKDREFSFDEEEEALSFYNEEMKEIKPVEKRKEKEKELEEERDEIVIHGDFGKEEEGESLETEPEEKVEEFPKVRKEKEERDYHLPSTELLEKGKGKDNGESTKGLKETAMHLKSILDSFGVKVTIKDISKGPTVTRYEMQPEQGVKVSKIVNLADDIKLNLAAVDVRIEAPIPGKAAVGIEVPNKETSAVMFRELIESKEFQEFPSKLAFAVGKDIAGKVVVTDIGKMPHLLIAGATGSGKSVCINTLIMSILYKASPKEVKLIMIDPKVVELSVYNGIPHLMVPVVTDPKKAAGALHWGVTEMDDRYQKFADFNVRDLKGYNKKLKTMRTEGKEDVPKELPQIIIIVDELADLMMVAPGEVEESICRLAQLARAAGIHLIIATQRPSVDVITGLIKANMPSRIAFSVSSGVDSRTILDMVGAEKLLGKGDMLFYPQGYSKPARMQGAFVSDEEVSKVVEFWSDQSGPDYNREVEEKMVTAGVSTKGGGEGGTERDAYFIEAARFLIEKDKASIGMLQRAFKVGFNRAARIMEQLADAGVVGEEEGTKPRKILMSLEQFEQYIEEAI